MVLFTSNKSRRLLSLSYVERVEPGELEKSREDLRALLAELPADFRLLADLSQLDFMAPECVSELGRTMELIDQHGVGLIVRVISDESKDIGLNILTIFHYAHHPRVITCRSLPEALRQLELWN